MPVGKRIEITWPKFELTSTDCRMQQLEVSPVLNSKMKLNSLLLLDENGVCEENFWRLENETLDRTVL